MSIIEGSVTIKGLVKFYGQHMALDGVDLDVPAGCCMVLLGPSGCGKSTLLKTINRLLPYDKGSIYLGQLPIEAFNPTELRRSMGYGIQGVGLFPHYTVAENIGIVPHLLKWSKARIDMRTEALMQLTELPVNYLAKYPKELSGGEAQRVGVARALAADPPILLMDEPFGAVDPLTREKLQTAFIDIQKQLKKTVLFVTHDVDEAARIGERIAIMQSGKVLKDAKPEAYLDKSLDPFIYRFLGREFPLSLLSRYTLNDFVAWAIKSHVIAAGTVANDGLQSLKSVLATMLTHEDTTYSMAVAKGSTESVSFESFRAFILEVTK